MRGVFCIFIIFTSSLLYGQGLNTFVLDTDFYNTYMFLGDQYYDQENYDSALLMYQVGYNLIVKDTIKKDFELAYLDVHFGQLESVLAVINLRIGLVCYNLDKLVNSIRHLHFADSYFIKNNIDFKTEAKSNYYLGLSYLKLRKLDQCLEHNYKALMCYINNGHAQDLQVGLIYINIGNVYGYKQEHHKAIEHYKKAISIFNMQDTIRLDKISIVVNNIGSAYYSLGNYQLAINQYNNAISLLEKIDNLESTDLSLYYHNLAGIYSLVEKFDSAEHFYLKGFKIRSAKEANRIQKSQSLLQLGIVSYFTKKYDSAIVRIQKAIELNTFDKFLTKNNDPLCFLNIRDHNLMASCLHMKALIYHSLFNQNKSEENYFQAAKIYDSLVMYYGYFNRMNLSSQETKNFAKAQKEGLGAALIFFYSNSGYIEDIGDKLFSLVEKGKAANLYRILLKSNAKGFSNIPDTLLKLENQIKQAIIKGKIAIEIAEANNLDLNKQEYFLSLIEKQSDLLWRQDTLIQYLERTYFEYFNLRYNYCESKISEIQEYLSDSCAILEFYFTDSNLFKIFITNNFVKIESSSRDSLIDIIQAHNRNIKFSDKRALIKTGTILYNRLMLDYNEQLNNIRKLIIVPDENLYYLPFESLICQPQEKLSEFDYLINRFEICYQYSSRIWLFTEENTSNKDYLNNGFLGIAPFADFHDTIQACDFKWLLPDSKEEIISIGNEFAKHRYPSTTILGNLSKDQFYNISQKYSYIHFATHGEYNEKNPELSSVFLSAPNSEQNIQKKVIEVVPRSKLYIGESYGLKLNANLIVLASCKSGLGNLSKSEGLISMTRGFLYSGARNILYSLWSIQDKHTSSLTKNLYKYLLLGDNPSRALQKAKIDLIDTPITSLPVFWSGLVLIGN